MQVQCSCVYAVESHAAPHRKKVPKLLGQLHTCWSTTLCIFRLEELWNALENLSESCGDEVAFAALAALAATASFAQSSVTLSGNLDFAYGNVSGNAKGNTISTRDVASTTSVINIIAVEDLGGGMKATVKYGLDPRVLANDNTAAASNTFGRDELYVGIEGSFGNIRLGSPNSIGLTTFLSASPLGTGIGSGYVVAAMDYSNIRYDRSARYDSPVMGGFSVSALYAPGGDQPAATTPSFIANNNKVTELGLNYANGPLTVGYVNIAQAALTNPTAVAKTNTNILAASYKFGDTTLTAGWNDGDARARVATTAQTSKGYRVGVRQDIGAIALIASYAEQETKTATPAPKEKVTGLRADYSFSKTAAAYLGYEKYDTGVAAAPSTTTGDRTIVSVGLRKSF